MPSSHSGGDASNADYTLRGAVRRTLYRGKVISYCLSVYGPALWFVGLPAGTSENTLEIHFTLQDKAGNEVWSHDYAGSATIKQGLYYNWGNDTLNFAYLMQKAMNEVLGNLSPSLPGLADRAGRGSPATSP